MCTLIWHLSFPYSLLFFRRVITSVGEDFPSGEELLEAVWEYERQMGERAITDPTEFITLARHSNSLAIDERRAQSTNAAQAGTPSSNSFAITAPTPTSHTHRPHQHNPHRTHPALCLHKPLRLLQQQGNRCWCSRRAGCVWTRASTLCSSRVGISAAATRAPPGWPRAQSVGNPSEPKYTSSLAFQVEIQYQHAFKISF